MRIPFLRPKLVELDAYAALLRQIDETRLYSNCGPLNTRFESEVVAQLFDGAGSAVTVCNATLGLMLAIRAVMRPGRFAVMPSFTFAATPLAAQWCGLEPYFVDIDASDWCVDHSRLIDALQKLDDEVAVVVPYATFGTALDHTPYEKLRAAGVPIVVDAAPCLGTRIDANAFGVGFGGPIVYSLHATKTFGVGEGGLVYSDDAMLTAEIRRLANFGFDATRSSNALGLNAKLSEYGAAIGLATLDVYTAKLQRRRELYKTYGLAFEERELTARGWQLQKLRGSVAHQFMSAATPAGLSNRVVVDALAAQSIEVRTYFSPACHQQPQFRGAATGSLSVTESLSERIVSLPLWDDMGQDTVRQVCAALQKL